MSPETAPPCLPRVRIGSVEVSRLIVGGNPFSAISHQSDAMDKEMRDYFTTARIKATLADCEARGINTFFGRCDNHVSRLLHEYRNEGGAIQWFAQTAPERASIEQNIRQAAHYGARGCYLHGATTQGLWEAGEFDRVARLLGLIRESGLAAGLACHAPDILLDLAGRGVKPDFYMMCFYNVSGHRGNLLRSAEGEKFRHEDREAATEAIRKFDRPAVGYKALAAGRNDPADAFAYAFRRIKPTDAICVGMYPGRRPDMVAENVKLALEAMGRG